MTISQASSLDQGDALGLADEPVVGRFWLLGLVAAVLWGGAAALVFFWPDRGFFERSPEWGGLVAVVAALILVATLLAPSVLGAGFARLRALGPWLVALPLGLSLWEVLTAKLQILPRPFFVPPQTLVEVYFDDWARLLESAGHSMVLLGTGYGVGAVAGFATGIAIGWSRAFGYWAHPIMRLLGPLPATAWLPIAFFIFPTSFSASCFLIALATWFPVTILTWSGISGVSPAYFDIARTLGAKPSFLIFKVAVPAAMPHVFVGLFMGLSASFAVLVVAEMIGVKSGFGWYLQWAQGWGSYGNMYAALLVMTLIFSTLITLLFQVRDRLLAWQKDLLKW